MITSMKEAFSVKGLNVFITGGNQGLGLGMAYLWYLEYADVPEDERFFLTHVGGIAGITANYLFHKNYRFSVEVGYLNWYSLIPLKVFTDNLTFPDYDGLYVGAGVTIKY